MNNYEWQKTAPKLDGDFFYNGPTPSGEEIVGIVGIVTRRGARVAYIFIPPGWRGDQEEQGTLHSAAVEEWKGEWAGPQGGLCSVEVEG